MKTLFKATAGLAGILAVGLAVALLPLPAQ